MIHGNVLPQRQNESTRLRGERDRKIENFAQIRFRHGFYNSLTAMRITIVPAATRQVLAFTFPVTDWFADGATAEFCITLPQNIARKPATLSHEAAASVPIGALTSWQGLIDRAKLESGERVLVHGGAGAVGLYAVQLAHNRGARVITTVSGQDIDFVRRLGADEAIDYKASWFEKEVRDVDVVFDAIGGYTLERSWGVLKPGGRMVTIAADSEGTADQRVKDAFFIVEPNQKQLVEIAKQLDAGHLRAFVKTTVPLNEAAAAYSGAVRDKSRYGKIVIAVPA